MRPNYSAALHLRSIRLFYIALDRIIDRLVRCACVAYWCYSNRQVSEERDSEMGKDEVLVNAYISLRRIHLM